MNEIGKRILEKELFYCKNVKIERDLKIDRWKVEDLKKACE